MPSPLAHTMAGVAIAWSAERLPPSIRPVARVTLPLAIAAAALAVLPDLDLLFIRSHRTYSHSIVSAALVTIVVALVTRWVTGRAHWGAAIVCGAAYASHLVLDWLGEDRYTPRGLQMFWPFSDHWFISDWNLFRSTERSRPLSASTIRHNVRTAVQELGMLGPFLVLLWVTRRKGRLRSAHPGQ